MNKRSTRRPICRRSPRRVAIGLSVLLILIAPLAWGQLSLSVEGAVEEALAADHSLAAGRSRQTAAEAATDAARMSRLPELSLTGRYARIEEQDPLSVQTPGGAVTVGETFSDAAAAELSLMQPLFLGGLLSSRVDQTRLVAEARSFEQLWRRATVKLEAQRAYWRLVEARLRREAFAERLDRVRANLETMEDRLGQGLVTRNQVLTVEMRLARAELELIDADNALSLASADLAVRIGEDPGTEIVPVSEPPERPGPMPPLELLVARGLAERPDLAAERLRLDAQAEGVDIVRSDFYPELFVTGNYTYARPNEALFPPPDRFEDSWRLGVMGRISLGSLPRAHQETRRADALWEAQHHSVLAAEEKLRLEVRRAYLGWSSSGQQVRLGETMVRQAEENLANTEVRVENGTALNEDLLDAQVDLLEARLALTSAVIGRELAWLEVMYSSATEM